MSVCFLHHTVNYCSFQRNITKLTGSDELTVGIIITISEQPPGTADVQKRFNPTWAGYLLLPWKKAFSYRECVSSVKVPCFCKSDCKISPCRDFRKSLSVFMNVRFCFPKQNRNGVRDRNSLFYFSCCEREQRTTIHRAGSPCYMLCLIIQIRFEKHMWRRKFCCRNWEKTHTHRLKKETFVY